MAEPRSDIFYRSQYVATRLATMFLHCWPVDSTLQFGKALGDMLYHVDRKHRKRAIANLQRSFPEKSQREIELIARHSMQQLVMLVIDILFTTRLIRIDSWHSYVDLGDIRPAIRLLMQGKKGVILLTGHYGNWEVLSYTLATFGFDLSSVVRPLDNPYLSDYLFGIRQRQGQRLIAKKGAVAEVSQTLKSNGVVGLVADQNAGSKGVFVDFFGRKASTYKSIGLLAMEFEAPVVIGYARRIGDRFRFRIAIQDIIYPEDWKSQDDPLRYITQRYTKAIEDFVRADPSQYLWVHRRWKSRPKGEAPERYD
jgi:Kdo2-lipid IVA lauroyltransferase/acyltransferase